MFKTTPDQLAVESVIFFITLSARQIHKSGRLDIDLSPLPFTQSHALVIDTQGMNRRVGCRVNLTRTVDLATNLAVRMNHLAYLDRFRAVALPIVGRNKL